MSQKQKLLESASIRKKEVDVEGTVVTVREIGAMEFAEYGKQMGTDRQKATAMLIEACVLEEDGSQMFTAEEALVIASTARMSMKIVNAVMDLSGFSDKEVSKKHADAS